MCEPHYTSKLQVKSHHVNVIKSYDSHHYLTGTMPLHRSCLINDIHKKTIKVYSPSLAFVKYSVSQCNDILQYYVAIFLYCDRS